MLEYIKGTLTKSTPSKATIEIGGLGYGVFISIATFEKLPEIGKEVKLYTSPVIREDSHKLFGFLTENEKEFFETICGISGIGPRLAISILGHMNIEDLLAAVSHSNVKAISKVPGIGKKMAERLVLELKDKFDFNTQEKVSLTSSKPRGPMSDAISALINLGYNPMDAQKAVQTAAASHENEPTLSQLISLALKGQK